MKVVINKCFGGFGVSTAGIVRMRDLGSEAAKAVVLKGERYADGQFCERDYDSHGFHDDKDRSDPALLQVIAEMGDKANGKNANLEIVDLPDDVAWEISEYDGVESIHEKHRSWS